MFIDDINDSGRTIGLLRDAAGGGGRGATGSIRFATLIDNIVSAAAGRISRADDRPDGDKDWFVFPWEALAPGEALAEDAAAVPERIA